jgi:hypothetical protein
VHFSAVYVGRKSQLTIVGAADGSSVLTLDPKPPLVNGLPAYCNPAHLLAVDQSSFVTLRGFTLEGVNRLLPQDTNQCPKSPGHDGRLNEHMHLVRLLDSTDVLVEQLKVNDAHGDGINLDSDEPVTMGPLTTRRVTVRGVDLYTNRRSGIALRNNVAGVTITGNTIRHTLQGGDIHMEPSGSSGDAVIQSVAINHNVIERSDPGISVSLGGDEDVFGRGLSFVDNVIRPEAGDEAGCVQVANADQVTITDNTVAGSAACDTVLVERSTNVTIARNTLHGYTNAVSGGVFEPNAVVDAHERRVTVACPPTAPSGKTCQAASYTDHVTIADNTVVQHLPFSLGIQASNSDDASVTGNLVVTTIDRSPAGKLATHVLPSAAVQVVFGLPPSTSLFYLNEQLSFDALDVQNNRLSTFGDGMRLSIEHPGVTLATGVLDGNLISGPLVGARGIMIGKTGSPTPFVTSLDVAGNVFGCGFQLASPLPLNAFSAPAGQLFSGTVGAVLPCDPP